MASAAHPLLHELSEAQRLLKDSRTPRATAALQSAHDDILAELVCDLADAQKLRQLAATDKAKSLLDAVIKSLESALPAISALPTPLLLDPALDPNHWPEAPPIDEPGCWRPPTHALRTVPRCDAGSEEARRLLVAKRPVVLTSAALVARAVGKWTPDFLSREMGKLPCTVYKSPSRFFRYWDDEKNEGGYEFGDDAHTDKLTMSMADFAELLRAREAAAADIYAAADDAATGASSASSSWHYLQTALVDGVGASMLADFRAFDWKWLSEWQTELGWSALTSNLLLVGEKGNVTPAHYDEQQNFFAQLCGRKRVILFPPGEFGALYPFPVHHPNDRQSQVDLYAYETDADARRRFPRFAGVRGVEALLGPGDVLHIPQYWWHHIENLDHGCVSLNFWFKDSGAGAAAAPPPTLPLADAQHLAMRRNIEKLVAQAVGAAAARTALPALARDAADLPPDVAAMRTEVVELLGYVLPKEEIDGWLRELVEGRFA